MPHALFISDLHLCPSRPGVTALFRKFMTEVAPGAEALYVLGDLFEYWAGDDDLDDAFNREMTAAFARLAEGGTAVYVMHGNRDLLLGDAFAAASRAKLLADPTLLDLYGTPTLVTHGDALCTDDTEYQAFRTQVREAAWQATFLAQPLAARKAIIQELRRKSEAGRQFRPADIMDVNPNAVRELLAAHGGPRLIHGHTHRPARHEIDIGGKTCERWVLPDWHGSGGYLRCDAAGCQAIAIPA